MCETESERRRRRWITLGELIALAALVVSAFGVWISYKASDKDGPTRVVEQRQPIPLTLRAKREDDGERLQISPVEDSHALQSLTVTIAGASIEVGSVPPNTPRCNDSASFSTPLTRTAAGGPCAHRGEV